MNRFEELPFYHCLLPGIGFETHETRVVIEGLGGILPIRMTKKMLAFKKEVLSL